MHHHMISSHMIPSLWHTIPFVGLILTLALLSASASSLWHRFEKAILACWVLLGLFSMHTLFSYDVSFYLLVETLFLHYLPFIGLILTLFIISCSIEITVYKQPTPLVNVLFLMIASVCASFIGTTGASILFIRPFLKLNEARIYKTHLVIFFILIVSNIAGSLTPLGDPPLFMGYLQGVPFFLAFKKFISSFRLYHLFFIRLVFFH